MKLCIFSLFWLEFRENWNPNLHCSFKVWKTAWHTILQLWRRYSRFHAYILTHIVASPDCRLTESRLDPSEHLTIDEWIRNVELYQFHATSPFFSLVHTLISDSEQRKTRATRARQRRGIYNMVPADHEATLLTSEMMILQNATIRPGPQ